jgi:hypothetical protein
VSKRARTLAIAQNSQAVFPLHKCFAFASVASKNSIRDPFGTLASDPQDDRAFRKPQFFKFASYEVVDDRVARQVKKEAITLLCPSPSKWSAVE